MKPVESSSVSAVGHDPDSKRLTIQFKSGETYHFDGVSEAHYAALVGAKSVGSYFQKHIRNRFKVTKA